MGEWGGKTVISHLKRVWAGQWQGIKNAPWDAGLTEGQNIPGTSSFLPRLGTVQNIFLGQPKAPQAVCVIGEVRLERAASRRDGTVQAHQCAGLHRKNEDSLKPWALGEKIAQAQGTKKGGVNGGGSDQLLGRGGVRRLHTQSRPKKLREKWSAVNVWVRGGSVEGRTLILGAKRKRQVRRAWDCPREGQGKLQYRGCPAKNGGASLERVKGSRQTSGFERGGKKNWGETWAGLWRKGT